MDYSNARSAASTPSLTDMAEIFRKAQSVPPVIFSVGDPEDERRLVELLGLGADVAAAPPVFPVGRIERLDALPKGIAQCVAGPRSWVIDLDREACYEINPLSLSLADAHWSEFRTLCYAAISFGDRIWPPIHSL